MIAHIGELWVIAAVAAAGFQTFRFVLQKVLSTATLSPTGATFARFVYSAPIIFAAVVMYIALSAQSVTMPSHLFWGFAIAGGAAQVLATICVVTLFKSRNFAVGVTLAKTETLLAAIVGMIVLGDMVSLTGFATIALGLLGVLLLSTPPEIRGWGGAAIWNRSVLLGLASGMLFAISAVFYRGASLEVISGDPFLRAGLTLSAVTLLQMVGMGIWLRFRDPQQIRSVWKARQVAIWVGIMSLLGSFCWFLAFTLQNAAYVKAVGQIELIFSLVASSLVFSEKSSRRELAGMAVLCVSILLLVLVV